MVALYQVNGNYDKGVVAVRYFTLNLVNGTDENNSISIYFILHRTGYNAFYHKRILY